MNKTYDRPIFGGGCEDPGQGYLYNRSYLIVQDKDTQHLPSTWHSTTSRQNSSFGGSEIQSFYPIRSPGGYIET